ncbi:hypothetical protein BD779DRAFT_1510048 [Infundibulicybe gibba]|nr:hypothetical protein BD779DRAFT_1510048 [Infundibulicybe gibba]
MSILFALAVFNIAITRTRLTNIPLLSTAAHVFNKTASTIIYSPILILISLAVLASEQASQLRISVHRQRIWLAWFLEFVIHSSTDGEDSQRKALVGVEFSLGTIIPSEHILLAWRIQTQTGVGGPDWVTRSIIEIASAGYEDYALGPEWTTPPIAESTPLLTRATLGETASGFEDHAPLEEDLCSDGATMDFGKLVDSINNPAQLQSSPEQAGSVLISMPSEEILYLSHIRQDNSAVADEALNKESLKANGGRMASILTDALSIEVLETKTTSIMIHPEQGTSGPVDLLLDNTKDDSHIAGSRVLTSDPLMPPFIYDAGTSNDDGKQHPVHPIVPLKSRRWLQPTVNLRPVVLPVSPASPLAASPVLVATPQLLALHTEGPTPPAPHPEITLKSLAEEAEETPVKLTRRAKKRLLKLRRKAEGIASLPEILLQANIPPIIPTLLPGEEALEILEDQPANILTADDLVVQVNIHPMVPAIRPEEVTPEIFKGQSAELTVDLPLAQVDTPLTGEFSEVQVPVKMSRGARRRLAKRLAKLREAAVDDNPPQIPGGVVGTGVPAIHQRPPPEHMQPLAQHLQPVFYPQSYHPAIRKRFPGPRVIYPIPHSLFDPSTTAPVLPLQLSSNEHPGLLCGFHQNAHHA